MQTHVQIFQIYVIYVRPWKSAKLEKSARMKDPVVVLASLLFHVNIMSSVDIYFF